jgi:polar amino acid transport system permease protein
MIPSLHWPGRWTRQQRSNATLICALLVLMLLLWLLPVPLSFVGAPIGENAQSFAEGARATVELTLVSGVAGLVLGVLAALGKTSPLPPLRWVASLYIWVIRGTPLLVQVLFVFFALPALVPRLQMSDFASAYVALALNVGAPRRSGAVFWRFQRGRLKRHGRWV